MFTAMPPSANYLCVRRAVRYPTLLSILEMFPIALWHAKVLAPLAEDQECYDQEYVTKRQV